MKIDNTMFAIMSFEMNERCMVVGGVLNYTG